MHHLSWSSNHHKTCKEEEKVVHGIVTPQKCDGQTSVVPISWIFDDNGTLKCRWTSSLSNIKNNSPPNPNWKVYDIVKIVGPSIEFHDLQQHHMTYKEITVQTRIPDDVHLKKSRNAMKRVGLKTKNVQLAKTPRYHVKSPLIQKALCVKTSGDCLDDNNESPDDSYLNSSQPNPVFLDTLQGNVAMHEDDHPKSSASSGKEPKETKCKVTMEKLFDLNTKILQQIQMLEQRQAVIMNDLAKVKSVLMKRAEEDAHEELFKQQQCSSFETFEAFCQRLEEDKNYRELYVHYLIHTHGSSNIGEMVRQALKSIASMFSVCITERGKMGRRCCHLCS
ncbi:uncharacterized protein LOC125265339 isoform X2 [Megalobrama amblycephala]|uniref:uncharacterized protein LOC125265339 isoform X2 n=1 Tax=Megalobrama amblycephala TaxID=75352 RepID=UPI0020141DA3|nr:uncharacterized protein LOC125265339 isoform X2 [Megalobrama amblycephala]